MQYKSIIAKYLLLLLWTLTLIWSLIGIYKLYKSPHIPVQIISKNNEFFLSENLKIISIDGKTFNSLKEIIKYIENQKIGKLLKFQLKKNGKIEEVQYKISSLKSLSDSIIILLVIISFMIVSLIVYLSKPEDNKVILFFILSLAYCFDTIGGFFPYLSGSFPKVFLYPIQIFIIFLIPSIIFHFFTSFPIEIKFPKKKIILVLFYSINLFFAFLFYFFSIKTNFFQSPSFKVIPFYYLFFFIVLFPFFICLYNLIYSKNYVIKNQAKWVLYSILLIGIINILTRLIPQVFINEWIVKNTTFYALIDIFFPLSIIISIKKYKLFDIDKIFYKTVLYFSLVSIFTLSFIASSYLFAIFFEEKLKTSGVASALFSIILTYPIYNFTKVYLKRIFYRRKLDEVKKIEEIKEKIIDCSSIEEIKKIVIEEFQRAIPVSFLDLDINKEPPSFKGNLIQFGKEGWGGYFAFGERLSEEPFSKEELNSISSLVKQIEKSIGYVILQNDLIEKEKLALLGNLTTEIAHEIKNPLNGIKLILSYLKEKQGETEENKILLREVDRLNNILNGILDYSKLSILKKQSFSITEYLNNIEKLFYEITKEKKFIFLIEKPEIDFLINADPDKLEQALLNLYQNAIDSLNERGGKILLKIWKEEKKCFFSIEDNGSGISKDELQKIFELGHTKKKSGTGIGLYVTKKIVEAHQGKIEVLSDEGKGSIFKLWIPI